MEATMKWTRFAVMAVAALASAGAAQAAAVPADAARELRAASQQLEEAALLRNVANDRTEAQHLLAARDLLREAEPHLDWSHRLQAEMLEHEIGRDVLTADDTGLPPPFAPVQSSATARVDRVDLAELARRGDDLAQQAAATGAAAAAGS
jgi:hypothetical protein